MISCKDYVAIQKKELKDKVSTFERKPKLCVVQIGNDQASNVYVRNKQKVCEEIGIEFNHVHIEDYENLSQLGLEAKLELLSTSNDGVILQLPIPDKYDVEDLQKSISREKDVDGFRPDSCFKPCTPKGIIDWLKYNDYKFTGKDVVVIGRSKIVGKPLVNMLIDEGATVTCCNSKSLIGCYIDNAELIISAIGKPKYFDSSFSWRHAEIIVDVGINTDENGKLCGDIDKDDVEDCCKEIYYTTPYITPVPNGVGILTVITLMKNVIEAYELQNEK